MKTITDDLDIDVAIINKIKQEQNRKSDEQFVQLELPLYDYPEIRHKSEDDEYKSTVIIIEI
jgi:hypothetical protein